MLQSKLSQFSLSPEGQILWQEKVNNPLPGQAVAKLVKGDHILRPVIEVIENDLTKDIEGNEFKGLLNSWLKTHMKEVLEPLMLLEIPQGVEAKDDAVSKIAQAVYDGLGIVPREELETVISELTPETRTDLRAKKIRLGPILVFIPALNKPAAVKLRALLWSLYNGAQLPAKTPADGVVSVRCEDEAPNEVYYRSIGYPYFGGRVIRIDMLDRVISCVYDHAQNGKFQARHEMAEWLGCPIDDLYKILEAMGHKKVYDPAEQESENKEQGGDVQETPVSANDSASVEEEKEQPAEASQENKEASSDVKTEEAATEEKPQDKRPELATFRLKRGKAFEKGSAGGKRGAKKPFKKDAKKQDSFKKGKKPAGKKNKDHNKPRVISVEAKKQEDSPFAILQQLKK